METLAKIKRRRFLLNPPSLMAFSFNYHLWQYPWAENSETKQIVAHSGRLNLFLRSRVILIHENDLVLPKESLDDFIKKLSIIRDSIKDALYHVDLFYKDRLKNRYVDKKFLNDIEGCSDIYTSTIAITMSETHGVTFEIGSCDVKSRITLSGPTESKKFFTAFYSEMAGIVEELEQIRIKNQEALELYGT
jgi:hypothetical protein